MPENKTIPVETIRSFFGEHVRRISFQSPIKTVSLQQRVEKQHSGMDSLREEISKILKCLLESNFPHKNVEDAVTLIEEIVEKEIDFSIKETEAYDSDARRYEKRVVFFERFMDPDGTWRYYEIENPKDWWMPKWGSDDDYCK